MMHKKWASPEKQLLELIENPEKKSAYNFFKRKGINFFCGSFRGRWAFFKGRLRRKNKEELFNLFNLKTLNTFLALIITFLAIYFIYTFNSSLAQIQRRDFSLPLKDTPPVWKAISSDGGLKDISYYLEAVRKRDIFNRQAQKASIVANAQKPPSVKILEATKDLKLVGIAWGAEPDAMIEDTASKRTLFLKRGQFIDNKIRVKAIFKDKVILGYGSEEVELR